MNDNNNGDTGERNGVVNDPVVKRRDVLRVAGVAGGSMAVAAVSSGSVVGQTTTEDGDGSEDDHWADREEGGSSDYIAKNTKADRTIRVPNAGEAAGMVFFSSPLTLMGAVAAENVGRDDLSLTDPTDWWDAGRGVVNDIYFGPFSQQSNQLVEDALVDAWYRILSVQQQLEQDLKSVNNNFDLAESQAQDALQTTARKAFNEGLSASRAKSECRKAVRRKFAGAESNLIVAVEDCLINIVGVFYQTAAAIDEVGAGLEAYWSYRENYKLSHTDSIHTPGNPGMMRADIQLLDGRVVETGLLNIIPKTNDTSQPETSMCHPLLNAVSSKGRWASRPSHDYQYEGYELPPVIYSSPDTVNDGSYRLLKYNSDLAAEAKELYNKIHDRVQVFDNDIDTFVDDLYTAYAGKSEIPASAIDTTALVNSLALDWQDTRSTGFARLFAANSGFDTTSAQLSCDVEILTGDQVQGEGTVIEDQFVLSRGDWIPTSTTTQYGIDESNARIEETKLYIAGVAYDGEHTVTFSDGSTVTRSHGQLDHSGSWTEAGAEATEFRLDLGKDVSLTDIEKVEATSSEAIVAGREYTVPTDTTQYPDAQVLVTTSGGGYRSIERGNRFIVTGITNANGESMDVLPMNIGSNQITETNTAGTETIVTRHTWTRSEQEEEQEDEGLLGGGGGGGGGGDGSPWWQDPLVLAGGAGAAVLAALGLRDSDGVTIER